VLVQSTVSSASDRRALTSDLYAVARYLMRTANMRIFSTIAELELSLTQIKTLCALATEPGESAQDERSVKALAESLGVSLAAMSRCVDGLFERGLVLREEDPSDRRMKRVRLTPAGEAVPKALNHARLTTLEELIDSLDEEDAALLGDALTSILASHREIAAHRPDEEDSER
jgi:DNA-binding MarR family transcriptional regulator